MYVLPSMATHRIVPPMTFIDRARAIIGLAEPLPKWPPDRLSLALQGGGSFGAFTWGVLDRVLEEQKIGFDAISGASAGAVNAVVMAAGMADGGRDEARARLAQFWRRMSRAAALLPKPAESPLGAGLELAIRSLSPYQFNPFNLNPLREALAAWLISSGSGDARRSSSCLRRPGSATGG